MKVHADAVPELTPDTFFHRITDQWLRRFFTPRELRGFVDRHAVSRDLKSGERWHQAELWRGEEIAGTFPLSHLTTDFSLFQSLSHGKQIELQFYGGLNHLPHLDGATPGWYGRVVTSGPGATAPWLSFLVTVRIDCGEFGRSLRVSFPFAGYPLTTVRPELNQSFAIQEAPESEPVEFNRNTLLSELRSVPELLQCRPADVSWAVEWQQALFPGDREALRQWQSRLQSG